MRAARSRRRPSKISSPSAQHPYTHGLLASIPRLDLIRGANDAIERLQEIPGIVPALSDLPTGCAFAPRCQFADDKCTAEYPPFEQKKPGHWAACWHSDALYGGKPMTET